MTIAQQYIPEFASWESTLRCNMQCDHCGVSAGPQQGGLRGPELNTEEAEDMMLDLVKLGVKKLIISGGEFTTRRDWRGLLELALGLFQMVRQISNGWLGVKLLETLRDVSGSERLVLSLSLDGLQATHNSNRRNGSFEKVVEILRTHSSIYRTVITTVMSKNFSGLDDIFSLLAGLYVPVWAIQLGLPAGYMPRSEFIGEEKVRMLADMIKGWQDRSRGKMEVIPDNCFGYAHSMRSETPWLGCGAGKRLITILSNGSITGCPTTYNNPCGNIREESLDAIWGGERMMKFRGAIPNCAGCGNSVCQGGCRAVQKAIGKQLCF